LVPAPARYREVIAVGAGTPLGRLASFSNSGPELDVIAPGTDVVSTNACGGCGIASGTSMAVPHVTAAVAMMLAINQQLDAAEVKKILKQTALVYDDDGDEKWITGSRNHLRLNHRSLRFNQAGELNLIGALEEVLDMSNNEDRYAAFQRQLRKVIQKIYREELKKKMRAAGEIHR